MDGANGDTVEEAGTMLPAITRVGKTMIAKGIATNRENFTVLDFIFLLYLSLEYNQSGERNQGLWLSLFQIYKDELLVPLLS